LGFVINAITYLAPLIALRSMDTRLLHPTEPAGHGRGGIAEACVMCAAVPELVAVLVVVFSSPAPSA